MPADDRHPHEISTVEPRDRGRLIVLLDEYLGELSGHRERPVGATNADEYSDLDAYFCDSGRHAFFVLTQGELAGFALIRGPESTGKCWQVAEFFIRPERRRSGIGQWAISTIWGRFPGTWDLQVHAHNVGAVAFWNTCVRLCTGVEPSITFLAVSDGRRLQFEFRVSGGGGAA